MKKKTTTRKPIAVPKKYGGQWVAWSNDRKTIIAHDLDLKKVREKAYGTGETDPAFEWIPPPDRRLMGTIL